MDKEENSQISKKEKGEGMQGFALEKLKEILDYDEEEAEELEKLEKSFSNKISSLDKRLSEYPETDMDGMMRLVEARRRLVYKYNYIFSPQSRPSGLPLGLIAMKV